MTHKQAAEAVVTWATAVAAADGDAPDLQFSYTHPISLRQAKTPNVACVTNRVFTAQSDNRFPALSKLGQRWLRVFEMTGSVMVDPGETEESADIHHDELMAIGNALEKAILTEETLRGNLPAGALASPERGVFDYSNAFVEYDDGTKGRIVEFGFAVAELVEHP